MAPFSGHATINNINNDDPHAMSSFFIGRPTRWTLIIININVANQNKRARPELQLLHISAKFIVTFVGIGRSFVSHRLQLVVYAANSDPRETHSFGNSRGRTIWTAVGRCEGDQKFTTCSVRAHQQPSSAGCLVGCFG